MSGESNTRLRAAVYQRILTDNIVGIDLQENRTSRWHDEKIREQSTTEGSGVLSHAGPMVIATPTLGGNSLDEKIIALANMFRLLYQKRRYEAEDTPLWWTWKHGKVTMRIALQRMHRWIYSTRPMDVIVLMRYAMTSFYVLADEGVPRKRTEVIYDSNPTAYRTAREADAEQLDEEPYRQDTDLSIALEDIIKVNPSEYNEGEGKRIITIKDEDDSIDAELEISWEKKVVDDDEEAKRRELIDLQSEKARLESINEDKRTKQQEKRLGQLT